MVGWICIIPLRWFSDINIYIHTFHLNLSLSLKKRKKRVLRLRFFVLHVERERGVGCEGALIAYLGSLLHIPYHTHPYSTYVLYLQILKLPTYLTFVLPSSPKISGAGGRGIFSFSYAAIFSPSFSELGGLFRCSFLRGDGLL